MHFELHSVLLLLSVPVWSSQITYPGSNLPTVNTIDTVEVAYTCSWQKCNLTLFCPQDNYDTYWWGYSETSSLESGIGTYDISGIGSIFDGTTDVNYPVTCHFELSESGDGDASSDGTGVNGGNFILVSTSGQAVTFASSTTASGTSTSASTTTTSTASHTTSALHHITSAAVNAVPTPSTVSSGLSTGAKAGIGVGVTLVVLALIALGLFILFIRRRRRRQAVVVHEDPQRDQYEKPELAATMASPTSPVHVNKLMQHPQQANELAAYVPDQLDGSQVHEAEGTRISPGTKGHRFELQ